MRQRLKTFPGIVSVVGVLLVFTLTGLLLCNCSAKKPVPSTESTGEPTVETQKPNSPSKPAKPQQTKPAETDPPETKPEETTPTTEPDKNNGNGNNSGSNDKPQSHMHSYKETVVDATCTAGGYTLHKCSCGASYTDTKTAALGHNYSTKTISPTTGSNGYDLHTCSRCGKQYKDNYTDPLPKPTEPQNTKPTEPDDQDKKDPGSSGGGGSNYQGGGGTPENEDYGYCPVCGIRLWTSWYPQGCFTYLVDTVCECGVLVHAMECHHH